MLYRVNDLAVDTDRKTVTRGGDVIALPDLSWRVFAALIERAPNTVTLNELAAAAWRQDHIEPDTITQRIKLIRKALGDDPASPRYIMTERGEGYRLLAPVEAIEPPRQFSKVPLVWVGVAATVLALIVGAAILSQSSRPAKLEASSSVSAAMTTDELIARAHTYMSRGSFEDNEAALKLYSQAHEAEPENVAAIIGMSFTQSHRATKYDFDASAAIQAEALARQALKAAPREASAWHALGFALDAQGYVNQALRAYEQAVAIDPDDHSARASAAYLKQIQGRLHEALLMDVDALSRGEPSLFSYIQIASALHLAGLDDAANAWRQRAATLTPDNLFLIDLQAEYLLSKGLFQQAVDELSAAENNKWRAALDVMRGEALLALGNVAEAKRLFAAATNHAGDNDEGAFALAALEAQNQIDPVAMNDHPLVVNLRTRRRNGDEWPQSSIAAAYLYAAIGDADGAISLINEAHYLGYLDASRLRHSPFFENLQENPDFLAVLAEMAHDVATQRALIMEDPRLAGVITAQR